MKAAFAAAAVLFLVSTIALWHASVDGDVVELSTYAHGVLHGQVPYRDFHVEYPPAVFALIVPAALGEFITWFRVENTIAWLAVLLLTALLLEQLHPRRARNALLLALVALTPLLLGPLSLMRFDGWATAVVLAALLLMLRRHPNWAMAALAIGTLVKAWPLGLVPLFLVAGVRLRGLAVYVGVVLAGLLPFMAVAPGGSYNGLMAQVNRHLEYESIGASILFVLHRSVHTYFETGSLSVAGSISNQLASVQSLLQIAVFLLAAVFYARSRRRPQDLVTAVALGVAAATALGKVLSPQYLLWLAPFGAIVDAPVVLLLVVGACAGTRALVAEGIPALADQRPGAVAALTVRNAFLVATTAVLAWRSAFTR